jgi:hypothetical protein
MACKTSGSAACERPLNYEPNAIKWRPGDRVLHDADAKNAGMLMRVLARNRNGMVRTEYLDPVLQKRWGKGRRSTLINPLEALHDPERFGVFEDRAHAAWHREKAAQLRVAMEESTALLDRGQVTQAVKVLERSGVMHCPQCEC